MIREFGRLLNPITMRTTLKCAAWTSKKFTPEITFPPRGINPGRAQSGQQTNEKSVAKPDGREGGFHSQGTSGSPTTNRAARARALVCGRMPPRHRFKRLAPG